MGCEMSYIDCMHNMTLTWYAQSIGAVALVSAITFLTPLASSMFAPGVPRVMETFHSTDDMLAGFMVSIYVLGFAVGPMSGFCITPVLNLC
jgi:MFS family permease